MTWSLLNEIVTDGTTTQLTDTVWPYHYDTALAGRTGFTVAAHPDASSTKRIFSYTAPNPKKSGSDSTRHYWASWTANYIYVYGDTTYTTTPGDLATYTGYATYTPNWNFAPGFGNYRWWTSDQNPRALLMTVGKRMGWYWPGFTEWALDVRGEDVWDGTNASAGMQWPMPFSGGGNYGAHCFGDRGQFFDSTTARYMYPRWSIGDYGTMETVYPNPTLFTEPDFWFYDSNSNPNVHSYAVAPSVGTDVAGYWPGSVFSTTSEQEAVGTINQQGQVILDTNTNKYWYIGMASTDFKSFAWDMGLTEPDMS